MNIKEIKNLNLESDFLTLGLVAKLSKRKDRNGNSFWDLTLNDSSGSLDCKIWYNATWLDNNDSKVNPEIQNLLNIGSVVEISGRISEFKEQRQYNISSIRILKQDNIDKNIFSKHSNIDKEILTSKFHNLLDSLHDPLKNFVDSVFFKYNLWNDFSKFPAAVSIHHAYEGGLLEHSVSVAELSLAVAEHYEIFNINIDKEIVIAGSLLHDIGKLYCYDLNSGVTQLNLSGNLLSHIVIGYEKFMHFAQLENLDKDITLKLGHIIISHHGKIEYGSAVPPEIPEALVVSIADNLDFMLNYWKSQTDLLDDNNFVTDFLPSIQQRFCKYI